MGRNVTNRGRGVGPGWVGSGSGCPAFGPDHRTGFLPDRIAGEMTTQIIDFKVEKTSVSGPPPNRGRRCQAGMPIA